MAFFLDEKEVQEAFGDATQHAEQFFDRFDEIERLAANEPKDNLPEGFPNVTDGSLSAGLEEMPKRVLAQLLTGHVVADDRDETWVAEITNTLWSKQIIPHANTDDTFFNKQQDWLYRARKYGAQPALAFFRVDENYAGADFVLPYVRQVVLEAGKSSDLAANYCYVTQYFSKYQLKAIIGNVEDEKKRAKAEGRQYETPWDVSKLKKLVDLGGGPKDSEHQNKSFYTFAPTLGEGTKAIVRAEKNMNPTGDMPVTFLYTSIERENPYGRGLVQLAGPTQNTLDFLTQSHILATMLGLRPPIKIKGPRETVDLKSLKWAMDKFWFVGNADAEPVKSSDTSIYSQLPVSLNMYRSSLQNLQGSTDGSVGSSSNNQFSKTDAGVNQQLERTGTNDSFLRRRHEEAYERLAANMINIHMANMQGEELIRVIDDEIPRLQRFGVEFPTDDAGNVAQELNVIYENLRGKFSFQVDANSSVAKTDQESLEKTLEILEIVKNDPNAIAALQQDGMDLKLGELYKRVFTKAGLEDVDKILVQMTPEDTQALKQNAVTEEALPDQETIEVDGPDPSMALRAEELMAAYPGMSEGLANQVAELEAQGYDAMQITEMLGGAQ